MRPLHILILCLVSITTMFGQGEILSSRNKFMTYHQNQDWLKTVKSSDKGLQLTEIRQRFLSANTWNVSRDSIQYSPLIVINGVPFALPDSLTNKYIAEVMALLNEKSVSKIDVADQQPDNWIFGRPFSGVVILTVDPKTNKKLFKVNSR